MTPRLAFGRGAGMDEKTRFIVRAVMTEYMILMIGAILIYLALHVWPKATGLISAVGALSVASLCVGNFVLILRTSPLKTLTSTDPNNSDK
jgi:hypothetical protein